MELELEIQELSRHLGQGGLMDALRSFQKCMLSVTDDMQNLLYGRRGWVLRWDVWPYIVSGVDGGS